MSRSKKKQTVLVVSETLTRGGLETRLLTQGTALVARGHRVLYATASDEVAAPLAAIAHRSFPGLAIGAAATARACADAADALANIIREYDVDVVHAHPFASLVSAALGSALAQVPLTVTAHGPGSFTGPPNLDTAIFDLVLPYASSIRIVSEELRAFIPTVFASRVHVLPNSVDLLRFQPATPTPRAGPWAFVGRLADGKHRALETFLRWAPQLGIDELHIVGEGHEAQALQERLATVTNVRLKFVGWSDDVAGLLHDGYAGVVGMGRVVLEACALGLPCVLAGYEQLHGLVTPERFSTFAFSNFSGRGVVPLLEPATLDSDLKNFDERTGAQLRQLLKRAHDEAVNVAQNEALLEGAQVVEERRAGLLQLYAAFRGAEPGEIPWPVDRAISSRLRTLSRRPGSPDIDAVLEQAATIIETRTRQLAAEQNQHIQNLRSAVAALTNATEAQHELHATSTNSNAIAEHLAQTETHRRLTVLHTAVTEVVERQRLAEDTAQRLTHEHKLQLRELRAAISSLSQHLDELMRLHENAPLRRAVRLVKRVAPSSLKRKARPLTARLRALLD